MIKKAIMLTFIMICLSSISSRAQILYEFNNFNISEDVSEQSSDDDFWYNGDVSLLGEQNQKSNILVGDTTLQTNGIAVDRDLYAPLGSGMFILVAAGMGYALAKSKKTKREID